MSTYLVYYGNDKGDERCQTEDIAEEECLVKFITMMKMAEELVQADRDCLAVTQIMMQRENGRDTVLRDFLDPITIMTKKAEGREEVTPECSADTTIMIRKTKKGGQAPPLYSETTATTHPRDVILQPLFTVHMIARSYGRSVDIVI